MPAAVDAILDGAHNHGHSLVMVAVDGMLVGTIELHVVIRPEAREIIDALRQRQMSLVIISGDHEGPTKQLAGALGIDRYFAETLPENKAQIVAQLQAEGHSVCFIGDGINDSIALKKANVSISMSGATTIATDTAQMVLMDGTLGQLAQLFDIAQNYNRNIKHSFVMRVLPNAVAIGGIVFKKKIFQPPFDKLRGQLENLFLDIYILFFHFGIAASVILYYMGLATGMGNSMLPILRRKMLGAISAK